MHAQKMDGHNRFLTSSDEDVDSNRRISSKRGDETISSRAGKLIVDLISSRGGTSAKQTQIPKRENEAKPSEKKTNWPNFFRG